MRNTDDKQIEEYTRKESEIKTNAKNDEVSGLINKITIENSNAEITNKNLNVENTEFINTQDILEKLKKLKDDLQNETVANTEGQQKIEHLSTEENNEYNAENVEQKTDEKVEENNVQEQNNLENNKKDEKEVISVSQVIEKAIQQNEVSPQSIEQLMQEYRKMENEVQKENGKKEEEGVAERLEDSKPDSKLSFDEMYQKLFGTLPVKEEEKKIEKDEKEENNAVDIVKNNVSMFEDIPECKKQPYKFIGIVFNTYIIIEMDKEMYIIDQHAAHERILYEKVKKNYYSESAKDSQMLLLPDIITLTHKEMDIAKENMDMFRKAGFDLDEFGENTIRLTGVPTICVNLDNKDLFLKH